MFPIELKEFRDYCNMFYGHGQIYDLGCDLADIEGAVMTYAVKCMEVPLWGGGDSVDRERVRAILEERGFEEVNPPPTQLNLDVHNYA